MGSVAGGLVNGADCQLTPPGSGMSVNVGPGEAYVAGSSVATQSGYYCRVSSTTNRVIAASDPTNPRIDRVVGIVADAAYSGSTNSFTVSVVTGTPTPGATLVNLSGAGAAPTSSLTLGYVLVPPTSTNVTGGNISNTAGTVGMANAASSRGLYASLPSAGQVGRSYYATDTKQWWLDNATSWNAPTLFAGGTSPLAYTFQTATYTAAIGQMVATSGTFTVTLPTPTANGTLLIANVLGGVCTVSSLSANLTGLGLSGASSFQLGAAGAYALLQSDGASWFIVAGQQDTGWVALTGLNASLTSYSPPTAYPLAARLQGDTVKLRGGGTNTSGSTVNTIGNIPLASMRPSAVWAGGSGATAQYTVSTSGGITGTISPGTFWMNGEYQLT